MGNGLVDALVAGRLGRQELAAGAVGSGVWFFMSLSCIGLLAGLSPSLSKLIGKRQRATVRSLVAQGMWIAVITGVIATVLTLLLLGTLVHWNLEGTIVPHIKDYLLPAAFSFPAFAVVMACRNVCEATSYTRGVLVVTLIGLVVNVVFNLGLGLGWFGLPRLGMFGIGSATLIVSIVMSVALVVYLRGNSFKKYQLLSEFTWPDWQVIKPLLALSTPIYLALVFEAGLFTATAIQMGMLGTLEAGAHYIAIGIAGACYMLPLGLSFALTARLGRVYGSGNLPSIKLRVISGVIITLVMALLTATVLLIFRYELTGLYSSDSEIRVFASGLLICAAIFQLSDAIQVSLFGILRGLGDTKVPMFINAFSYWGIAFCVGDFLAHKMDYGAYGLWAGLIIGLTVAAVLLCVRLRIRLQQVSRELTRST